MGEAKRRQDAGFKKPIKQVKNRHNWMITTPSRYVRWIVVGPEQNQNRAGKRKARKQKREMMRLLADKQQREAIRAERKAARKGAAVR